LDEAGSQKFEQFEIHLGVAKVVQHFYRRDRPVFLMPSSIKAGYLFTDLFIVLAVYLSICQFIYQLYLFMKFTDF